MPEEEESQLKEKSVLAKGSKTQLAPRTSAGPSHASEMELRLVCVKKPVMTRPSSPQTRPAQMGKVQGNFKGKRRRIFITWDLISK